MFVKVLAFMYIYEQMSTCFYIIQYKRTKEH